MATAETAPLPVAQAVVSPFAPNSTVYLVRPLSLTLAHGKMTLPKGAAVKVLQNRGATLVIQCNGNPVEVIKSDVATEKPAPKPSA